MWDIILCCARGTYHSLNVQFYGSFYRCGSRNMNKCLIIKFIETHGHIATIIIIIITKKGRDPTLILSDQLYDVPLSDSISILLFFPPLPYFLSFHLSSFLFSLHFSLLSHFFSFYFVCCLNKLIVCYTMFPYT